jgi:hypothetical protein
LSSYGQKPPSVERDSQFQFKMLRKFEETASFMYQMHASPEKPFARWDTMVVAPMAIPISTQTTLFVDPFNISEIFQRVTARAQQPNATQENPSASLGRTVAIMCSTETHATTKYVGIFLKNTLLTIQQLNPHPRRLHLDEKRFSEAWETEAVPAMHQAVDKAYGTNIGTNYNPNNDGRMQQAVQNLVLDPLWLFPMARLVEGVNQTLKGATATLQELGSAIKTARVALETPGAMKPAFATNRLGRQAVVFENAATAETQAAISARKMLRSEAVSPIAQGSASVRKQDVFAPDRKLPMTKHGRPIPDTDAPHTQLGFNEGSKGSYVKAREFDKDGNVIRDIEFTDHGRPHNHTNPHQHRKMPNESGGTLKREDAEPVPEWEYKKE